MIVLCGLHLVRDEEPNQRDARRERRHRAGIGSAGGGRADDPRTVTLKPGEGAEIKLLMKKGAKANYTWTVAGGVVNFRHARRRGRTRLSDQKGRGAPEGKGVIEAALDGHHGWFWRNRGRDSVTVKLEASGDYGAMKRM